jgi:hypothetical protein
MNRVVHPGSGLFTHPGSRGQKRHRIPEHCLREHYSSVFSRWWSLDRLRRSWAQSPNDAAVGKDNITNSNGGRHRF